MYLFLDILIIWYGIEKLGYLILWTMYEVFANMCFDDHGMILMAMDSNSGKSR